MEACIPDRFSCETASGILSLIHYPLTTSLPLLPFASLFVSLFVCLRLALRSLLPPVAALFSAAAAFLYDSLR